MPFDYNSLLLAIGVSGAALSLTLLLTWLSQRQESFLLTWALGMATLVMAVIGFNFYGRENIPWVGCAAFALVPAGFAVLLAAVEQFCTSRAPLPVAVRFGLPGVAIVALAYAAGYSGLGAIASNLAAALLLLAASWRLWVHREQAWGPLLGLACLYAGVGASFLLCGLVLFQQQAWVISGTPRNWAEDVNAFASIFGISGIGAITIALNQYRLTRRHQADAQTDPMTSLLNRRALFELHGELDPGTAVIIFDLDDFKSVNDDYGHAAGDALIVRFSRSLQEVMPPEASGARLGGEEFVVVMPHATVDTASFFAEHVRQGFARDVTRTPQGLIRRTVSAGVAAAGELGDALDDVLREADNALYVAKREGRNRVRSHTRLVA